MGNLIESLLEHLNPLVNEKGILIEKLEYAKKGKDYYLTIYVEKEDEVLNLDDVCAISELISAKLDEIDLIKENYVLDVSTSGAEKPITDFTKFPKYVGKYIYVKFKNPFSGLNDIEGTLEKVENDTLTISYRIKTRTKTVDVDINNISKANLAIKF